MADQRDNRSTTDQILDLLLDALAERQKARIAARQGATGSLPTGVHEASPEKPEAQEEPGARPARKAPTPASGPPPATAVPPGPPPPRPQSGEAQPPRPPERQGATRQAPARPAPPPPRHEPQPGEEGWAPPPHQPSINMGKMLGRLAILVAALIVLVNIPVNSYGVSLARIMPEASSLIIRDGLVLKGSGPEIYMLEGEQLRWISSMDAFEHLGLAWKDVHVVEDSFLDKFEKGRPIHVLLKCGGSDHIYRLENNQKRWIQDIDTFLAEGHVWDDVRFVSCQYLRDLPTGPSIPEDAGSAPEP
jgi:hypothetical protein